MTELFHTILMRVALAGIASAAALRLAGEGALREIVRFAAGLLLLLALLQPLQGLRLPTWGGADTLDAQVDFIEQQNVQTTMSTLAAAIAEAVEQRAEREGFDCTVDVQMATDEAGILQVDRVTVHYGGADAGRLDELRVLLTEECGVPAERQELIEK